MYLCDTVIIQDKHHDIPWATSQEVINLITGSLVSIPDLAGLLIVNKDDMMGNYDNYMD